MKTQRISDQTEKDIHEVFKMFREWKIKNTVKHGLDSQLYKDLYNDGISIDLKVRWLIRDFKKIME